MPKSAWKGKVLKSLEEEVDYLMQSFSEPGGSRQITVTETKSSQKVDLTGVAKNIPVKVSTCGLVVAIANLPGHDSMIGISCMIGISYVLTGVSF